MRRPTLILSAAMLVGAMLGPVPAAAQSPADAPDTAPSPSTTAPSTTAPSTTAPSTTDAPTPTTAPSTTLPPTTLPTTLPTGGSPEGTAPEPPKVRGVGDSVFLSAQRKVEARLQPEYRPRFRSVLGATIEDMTPAARDMVGNDPAAMVLGLGNPDMALVDEPNPPDVFADAQRILNRTATVPCVVWVNLKQRGVNGYYNQHWEAAATAFDQWLVGASSSGGGLYYSNLHILDWNAATVGHPGWFLADGLHLNETGQANYARKIDRFLNRVCPP